MNLERIWKILLRNVRLLKRRVRRVKKELAYERLDWVPYPRNEPFSPLISQDATKFVLPLVFILIESAKSPLPVDMRHSMRRPNYSYSSSRDDLTWLNRVNVLEP